jgi:hypothetical protein
LRRARDFALNGRFQARNLANVFHSIATLCATRRLDVTDGTVEETWAALEGAAVPAAPDMKPQEVSNALWAYAMLGGCQRARRGRRWRARRCERHRT